MKDIFATVKVRLHIEFGANIGFHWFWWSGESFLVCCAAMGVMGRYLGACFRDKGRGDFSLM